MRINIQPSYFTEPCSRLIVEGPLVLEPGGIVGGIFELIINQLESGRVVFKKVGGMIYLYYANKKWWFGDAVGTQSGLMRVTDNAQLPQDITATWEVSDENANWTPENKVKLKCLSECFCTLFI